MFKIVFKKKPKASPKHPSRHLLKLSEIQKATKNFDESLLMGRGYIGNVYYGELLNGEVVVRAAIKRFSYPGCGPTVSWPDVEKQRLYTLRHPNLVSLIGYCKFNVEGYQKETILVYEYILGRTTLNDHLHKLRTPLTWIRRLEICVAVAHGLQYLHEAGVMHGDIRSSNILMTESLVPKITDYGLSELSLSDRPSFLRVPSRACGYVDRFFGHYGGLTMKSDVYSFGVLLLELLCGKPILDGSLANDDPLMSLVIWFQDDVECSRALEDVIDEKVKDEISPECFEHFFEIARRCMLEFPQKRPDMSEVLASVESVLTLQKRLKNPFSCAPSVKELAFDDLVKATRGFSQNPLLDEAALGKVPLGWVDRDTLAPSEEGVGIAVAVKSIPRDDRLEGVDFLGQLDHPNIIKLQGCCSRDRHENLLVYEHMQRSLPHCIHGDDGLEPLSWGTRLNILIGVARGMAYLYTDKGVLCNFQCDDILLDEDSNAKLGGFGWVEVHERHDRKQLKGVFGYLKADYDPDTGMLPKPNDKNMCF